MVGEASSRQRMLWLWDPMVIVAVRIGTPPCHCAHSRKLHYRREHREKNKRIRREWGAEENREKWRAG